MKKIHTGSERDYLHAMDDLINDWIRTEMYKATETYKHWQHDKGSWVYGYIMGLKAVQAKLRDRVELLAEK